MQNPSNTPLVFALMMVSVGIASIDSAVAQARSTPAQTLDALVGEVQIDDVYLGVEKPAADAPVAPPRERLFPWVAACRYAVVRNHAGTALFNIW